MKPFSNPACSGKITPNIVAPSEKLAPSNANAYLKPPKVRLCLIIGYYNWKDLRQRWRSPLQEIFSWMISRKGKSRLQKGGFAKCYEATEIDGETNRIFAAKIVQKSSLTKSRAK